MLGTSEGGGGWRGYPHIWNNEFDPLERAQKLPPPPKKSRKQKRRRYVGALRAIHRA